MDSINISLFNWLHAGAGNQPVLDFISVIGAELSPYLVLGCMAIFWFTTERSGKRILLEGAAVVALGLGLNQLITLFYFHPRPFMMDLCKPLIPHVPETSFPSDHATLLFSAAFALLFREGWHTKGALLLFIAVVGAWGRIYTGLHFPFDIAGSFIVALTSMIALICVRSRFIPIYDWIIHRVNSLETLIIRKDMYRG